MKLNIIIIIIIHAIQARDFFTIDFIKSFIEYERVTDVNVSKLGWSKGEILNLVKVLSNASVKSVSSSEIPHKSSTLFVVDLRSTRMDVFKNVTEFLRFPYRWLILDDGSSYKDLQNLPLLLDSDFVVAVQSKLLYRLTELYKSSIRGSTISKDRGYFDGALVDIRAKREMFPRRSNLMGCPLVMSNVIEENNASKNHYLKEERLDPYDTVSKVSWYVSRLVFEMLNATPVHIFSYSYGTRNGDIWTGMTNDLAIGRADLGTSCDMDAEKMDVVTFTDSVVPVDKKFIFRQPPLSYITNIYILVFSKKVWIAVTICAAIATVAIYLESKSEPKFTKSASQLDGSISDAVFLTMSAVSQQGCYMEPRRLSGRIIAWVTFTSMMATYVAYSANIFVLLQAPSTAVTSLEQLADSKMALAAVDTEYNRHNMLKQANDHNRMKIYKKIAPAKGKENYYDLDVCVKNMRQYLFAFHGVLEPVYRRIEKTFLESEKCNLMEVDYVNDFHQHIPIHKHSPYVELFRVSFKRISESGITSALNKRFLTQRPVCADQGSAFSSIGVDNVRPVLALMGLGVGTAVVILGVEIIVYRVVQFRDRNSCQFVDISKKIKV